MIHIKNIILWLVVTGLGSCATYYHETRVNVLSPTHKADELIIMNFSKDKGLNSMQPGWYNIFPNGQSSRRKTIPFVEVDGKSCAELKTRASVTNLFREVDIPVDQFPILSWEWSVVQHIASTLDERTIEGDDHPIRIIITLETTSNAQKELEFVWGNEITAPQLIMVDASPRFVVRGGTSRGWFTERINLLELYEKYWPQEEPIRITDIGIASDTDQTHSESLSYIANLRVSRL